MRRTDRTSFILADHNLGQATLELVLRVGRNRMYYEFIGCWCGEGDESDKLGTNLIIRKMIRNSYVLLWHEIWRVYIQIAVQVAVILYIHIYISFPMIDFIILIYLECVDIFETSRNSCLTFFYHFLFIR